MNGKNYSQFLKNNSNQYSNENDFIPKGLVSNLEFIFIGNIK
jgi:hypothetical protein